MPATPNASRTRRLRSRCVARCASSRSISLGRGRRSSVHRQRVCQTEPNRHLASLASSDMTDDAIVVEGLEKSYGSVRALCGVDFAAPDRERARPARPERRRQDHRGADPRHAAGARRRQRPRRRARRRASEAAALRAQIGLAGQYAAVDENLTGVENLEMVGRLYHLGKEPSRQRAERAARAVRPHGCRQAPGQDLLGRHAPPARPRRRARGPAAGAVPRRADDRPRPPQPHRHVGDDRGARGTPAPPCCSPPSTSTRPTGSPTGSWWSTTAR